MDISGNHVGDAYFTINIDKGEIYRNNIIDAANIIKLIVENGDSRDVIYIAIIAVLVSILLIMIIIIRRVYVKEINRLARERSGLIHDIGNGNFAPLKKHNSSEKRGN